MLENVSVVSGAFSKILLSVWLKLFVWLANEVVEVDSTCLLLHEFPKYIFFFFFWTMKILTFSLLKHICCTIEIA